MVFAIVLFWALGAYNRLMRLRSAVAQAFGSFDAHMVRLVALLGEFGAAHAVQRADPSDGSHGEMVALQGATTQLSACLAVVRSRPFATDAVAALTASRQVLRATWEGAVRQGQGVGHPNSHDTPEVLNAVQAMPVPSLWSLRWEEHDIQNEQARHVFNDAVSQYNAAIAQFPASWLARVFGFKAAREL